MLIRTTKASTVNNTQTSSLKRAGGIQIETTVMLLDTTSTLSRTSTEGTLQTGLKWYSHRQRIKSRTSAIILNKCLLVPRIHSSETVTINRAKSHSSLQRSIRQTLMINQLKMVQHPMEMVQHQMERRATKTIMKRR